MFRNHSDINAYKNYQKTKIILFILLLILPFTFLVLYFDNLLTCLIFNIKHIEMLRYFLDFSLWRIFIFSFLQYVVATILWSIYFHTVRLIKKKKEFFLK
jgi:hypothetical protein